MPRPPKRKNLPKSKKNRKPIRAVTFDCYGTLVDWRQGAGEALAALLPEDRGFSPSADELFVRWEGLQYALLAEEYRSYREVMEQSAAQLFAELGWTPSAEQLASFPAMLHRWPLFEDVPAAIERLLSRYRVGIISNTDDDLLRGTLVKFGRLLAPLSTAERARAYKPYSARAFRLALDDLGLEPAQVVHHLVRPALRSRPRPGAGLPNRLDRPRRRASARARRSGISGLRTQRTLRAPPGVRGGLPWEQAP